MGGGQPNLGNACILGASGPATPPLELGIFQISSAVLIKGWVGGTYAPKILALPERGGGALPLARIFLEDLSTMH